MKVLDYAELRDAKQLYGLLFWAPWAEPSLLVEQLLDDQAEEYPAVVFGKVSAQRPNRCPDW